MLIGEIAYQAFALSIFINRADKDNKPSKYAAKMCVYNVLISK